MVSMVDDADDDFWNDAYYDADANGTGDGDGEDLVCPSPLATAAMSSTLDWLLMITVLVSMTMIIMKTRKWSDIMFVKFLTPTHLQIFENYPPKTRKSPHSKPFLHFTFFGILNHFIGIISQFPYVYAHKR